MGKEEQGKIFIIFGYILSIKNNQKKFFPNCCT